MVNQRDKPSWGYMVDHGTTFWEAFDADTKNLSRNHWTHSAVAEWLWRDVAGLSADESKPGYQAFIIHPRPTAEVTWCKADYQSAQGAIRIDWRAESTGFQLNLTVPVGATATVYLPTKNMSSITEGGVGLAKAIGVKVEGVKDAGTICEVGSGSYAFITTNN